MDNLSKCAKEAQKQGISYGQYMAQKWEREKKIQAESKAKMEERKMLKNGMKRCENELCNAWFKPRKGNQKYCCQDCYRVAYYGAYRNQIIEKVKDHYHAKANVSP